MERLTKIRYPEKTTVNLVPQVTPAYRSRGFLPGLALILVGAALFSNFAVVAPLRAADEAEAKALAAEQQLWELRADNTAYDAVRAEYSRYFSSDLGDQLLPVSSIEVLDLVESVLRPEVGIYSLTFANGCLVVELTGTNLTQTSQLLAALGESPLVSSVELSSASDKKVEGETTRVSMTVMLRGEGGAER